MTAIILRADPLAARCPYCTMPPGELCVTRAGAIRLPHAARRRLALTLAAHSDPVLDTVMAPGGPCGICGTPGLTRRHRVIDAIAGQLAAGEEAEDVAAEALAAERARPCPSGKVRHHKKRHAERAARKQAWLRYPACPDWLRVYQCPSCRGWHLTSRPARVEDLVAGTGGER